MLCRSSFRTVSMGGLVRSRCTKASINAVLHHAAGHTVRKSDNRTAGKSHESMAEGSDEINVDGLTD